MEPIMKESCSSHLHDSKLEDHWLSLIDYLVYSYLLLYYVCENHLLRHNLRILYSVVRGGTLKVDLPLYTSVPKRCIHSSYYGGLLLSVANRFT